MSSYYGYGCAHPYGSDPYAIVGQEFDPAPPRLQAYERHAERQVAALATRMPTTSFFTWILDADGREYVHPFASSDAMGAMLRRKNRNYYYVANFDKTGPVWPKPNASGYGCHSPEWTTWPSEFPVPQVACPSTVSGGPWGYVGQAPTPPTAPPPARALPDLNDPAVAFLYLQGKFALLLQLLIAAGVISREQEYGLHQGAYSIARLPRP